MNKQDLILKPVETQKASEAIYEQIRDLILKGELKPGDRLPSERSMMNMLQRSRHTIREALRMLESAGLLKTIPGSGGAVVLMPSSLSVEQPLEDMIALNQITHAELLEYRELNEVSFAGWAAERRTPEDLEQIADCIAQSLAVTDDYEAFIQLDVQFHQLIAQAGHNHIAFILHKVITNVMTNVLHTAFSIEDSVKRNVMIRESLEMHKQLYEAILEQDTFLSKKIMLTHIRRLEHL